MSNYVECPDCEGIGNLPGRSCVSPRICPRCDGLGNVISDQFVEAMLDDPFGQIRPDASKGEMRRLSL